MSCVALVCVFGRGYCIVRVSNAGAAPKTDVCRWVNREQGREVVDGKLKGRGTSRSSEPVDVWQ